MRFLAVVTVLAAMAAPATATRPASGPACMEIGDPVTLIKCQLALEGRRAGGPRKELVVQKLARLAQIDARECIIASEKACLGGAVPCGALARLAPLAEGVPLQYREGYIGHLNVIAREAALQDLGPGGRRSLFLRLIRARPFASEYVEGVGTLTRADATRRSLEERDSELLDAVELETARDRFNEISPIARPLLPVSKCELGAQPAACLVRIVEMGLDPSLERSVGQNLSTSEQLIAADRAIQRLRLLNDISVIPELKRAASAVRPSADGEASLVSEHGSTHGDRVGLGVLVAQLIGDLGERAYERSHLKQETLWDQVHKVETLSLARGKMLATEGVTTCPE